MGRRTTNRAPPPSPVAVRHDAAAVQFGKLAHHGESQAEAAVPAFAAGIGLAEGIEYMGEELPLMPSPSSATQISICAPTRDSAECDVTAARRELHCVR